jgi:hypothetical protein
VADLLRYVSMDVTLEALSRLGHFARAMTPTSRSVDLALPATRALFAALGIPYLIVGGVAVVHHGYLRTTDDIDVLVEAPSLAPLAESAAAHGFRVESRTRLRHVASGVAVDLLISGEPMPRPGSPHYPFPDPSRASPTDKSIADLALLCELKLHAHRHRDLADVVELLQRVNEGQYLEVEAAMPEALRPEIATLRRDALEEERFNR